MITWPKPADITYGTAPRIDCSSMPPRMSRHVRVHAGGGNGSPCRAKSNVVTDVYAFGSDSLRSDDRLEFDRRANRRRSRSWPTTQRRHSARHCRRFSASFIGFVNGDGPGNLAENTDAHDVRDVRQPDRNLSNHAGRAELRRTMRSRSCPAL